MIRLSSCTLVVLITGVSFGQVSQSNSFKRIAPGFNFGLNQSVLFTSDKDKTYKIENAPGFRLGVFTEIKFSKNWSLIPRSELSFNSGRIIENDITYRVDPHNLDVMLYSKHLIETGKKKVHPFWNFGPNLRIPLTSNFEGITYATKTALAIDFGFGFELALNHFNLSPELRFSGGVTEIRRNPYGSTLKGSNAVLALNFTSK